MLKRLRLEFMVMAGIMLAFIGFSSFNEAMGARTEVCPGVPFSIGWIRLDASADPDTFAIGLLGTIETFIGHNVAENDWMFNGNGDNGGVGNISFQNTTLVGSQLISWWTRANGRNTLLQVTNTNVKNPVLVHVQILGPDCLEILDFDDSYTANDTHVYDFTGIVTNAGQSIGTAALTGTEGIVVITSVLNQNTHAAIVFDFLQGYVRIINAGINEYGTNVYARSAELPNDNSANCPAPTPPATDIVLTGIKGCTYSNGTGIGGTKTGSPALGPTILRGLFSTLSSSPGVAASDVVLIALADDYGVSPNFTYSAIPGGVTYHPEIFDNAENGQSCPGISGCFVRLGLDDTLPVSESFTPISPTPTAVPTATPATCSATVACPDSEVCVIPSGSTTGTCVAPTPTPTKKPSGGGGGGCSIGGPVEIGTAMANVLVPLVPAFAIGFRVLRRRAKKNQKK